MGIGLVARQAYYKISALEELLIFKGIIKKEEAENHYQEVLKNKSEQRHKLCVDFWNRIEDGDHIEHCGGEKDSWDGIVLAKSVKPWEILALEIVNKRKSKHKEGIRFVLAPCTPSLIIVIHKNGEREQLAEGYSIFHAEYEEVQK